MAHLHGFTLLFCLPSNPTVQAVCVFVGWKYKEQCPPINGPQLPLKLSQYAPADGVLNLILIDFLKSPLPNFASSSTAKGILTPCSKPTKKKKRISN